MGDHYIPVNSLKLDGVSIQPEVYCPANGFPDPTKATFPEVLQNYPEALGAACTIAGYIPDPTIPISNPDVELFIANKDQFIPVDSYKYLLYLIDRDLSANKFFYTQLTTALENVVLKLDGTLLVTHANNYSNYNLSDYSESKVIIRLKFNAGTNVNIKPSQPSGLQSSGLISIISTVQSAAVDCTNQKFLKKISFLEPLVNISTLVFNGCSSLYNIAWADSSFEFLVSAANAFKDCGFQLLTDLPSMPFLTNASYFISGCQGLEEVIFPFAIDSLTNANYMMYKTPKLKKINGIGVGETLTFDFVSVTSGSNLNFVFGECAFDGNVKIGLGNVASTIATIFDSSHNIRSIEFLSLGVVSTSAIIKSCKGLINIKFPDSYRGTAYILANTISGDFDSLEEIQFPMDESEGAAYSNSPALTFLGFITSAPKLRVVKGRLKYSYTFPAWISTSNSPTTAFTFSIPEGRFPLLEEIDYPGLPFTSLTVNYCKLNKFNGRILMTGTYIQFLGCKFPATEAASIMVNTTPVALSGNTYRNTQFIGNSETLPIFSSAIASISAQTNYITEDTWRCLKSGSAGTPAVGMKHARTFFATINTGTSGTPLTAFHAGNAGQALPVGTKIIFVGSYNSQANLTNAVAAGLPIFQDLYIVSSTNSSGQNYYTFSTMPGGAAINLATTLTATLSINMRILLDVLNVTEDALYWYLTHNLSTFNSQSNYNNGLSAIFDEPIDSNVMLMLNRGLVA